MEDDGDEEPPFKPLLGVLVKVWLRPSCQPGTKARLQIVFVGKDREVTQLAKRHDSLYLIFL